MTNNKFSFDRHGNLLRIEQFPMFFYVLKWLAISLPVSLLIGSASALLLVSLNLVTDYREANHYIIAALPLAGLLIGMMYHYLWMTICQIIADGI